MPLQIGCGRRHLTSAGNLFQIAEFVRASAALLAYDDATTHKFLALLDRFCT